MTWLNPKLDFYYKQVAFRKAILLWDKLYEAIVHMSQHNKSEQ